MTTQVLYEEPGPRAKRRSLFFSVAVGVLMLAVLTWVLVTLGSQGQLTVEKWGPLIDPTNGTFGPLWSLLGLGLLNTLLAAVLAMAFSLVLGTTLALSRITAAAWYRWAVVGLIELLRGVPVVIAIFFASRVLPEFGVDLSMIWYLVIGLTAYNMVIIAEIVRAGILALPQGQAEAAFAVGMTRGQVLRTVQLPQAFRAMLPALISQLVVILKDTSLGFIISYEEFVRQGQIIIQLLGNPIQTYFVIAVVFIVLNYALTRLAIWVEHRVSHGRKAASEAEAVEEETAGA